MQEEDLKRLRDSVLAEYVEQEEVLVKNLTEDLPVDGVHDDYKEKVQTLVARAVKRNITSTLKKVIAKKDPYLLDAFHDALVYHLKNQSAD